MYAEGHKVRGAPKLPLNMLDALREYDKDKEPEGFHGRGILCRLHQDEACRNGTISVRISLIGKKPTRSTSKTNRADLAPPN